MTCKAVFSHQNVHLASAPENKSIKPMHVKSMPAGKTILKHDMNQF
jgi:hypothetical protein